MAASGSQSELPYDVFLCHRGETKRGFSVFLKNGLEEQGMTTFFDDRTLRAGNGAPGLMDRAMQTAKVGVVVLSPGFFASGYCMKELKVFLDRGIAIPIGVDVTADDCYADAIVGQEKGTIWEKHGGRLWESCSESGQVWSEQEWRDVVRRVKQVTILELHKFDKYWDKCIAEAVQITAEKLGRPVVARSNMVDMTPFHKNRSFLGRDAELEAIAKELAESGCVSIYGMAGIGKTQLALEYVYRNKKGYGKILWVNADGANLKSSFLALADCLGVQLEKSGAALSEDAAVGKVRDALELSKVPCLLVLDNVEDQNNLTQFMPRFGPCHILLTTRLRALVNIARVAVRVLGKEDGLGLLRTEEDFSEGEESKLEELAEKLGYLTLALAVSSRLLAEGRCLPSELLKRLEESGPLVFDNECADPVFKTNPSLVLLFQASFKMLEARTDASATDKDLAWHLTWVGGWFASAPIRETLLAEAALILLKSMGGSAQAKQAQDALGFLVFYTLATRTKDGKVSFHPLVQSFGKWFGTVQAGHAMIKALLRLGNVDQEVEHFQNAIDKATPQSGNGTTQEIPLQDRQAQKLVFKVAEPLSRHYLRRLYRPREVEELVKRCRLLLRMLEVSKAKVVWASVFLMEAEYLGELGRYNEAEPLSRQSLGTLQSKYGANHSLTAYALNFLAALLLSQGKLSEAEPLFRQCLEIDESGYGACHRETATSFSNLAYLLAEQGRHDVAEPLYRRGLKILEVESQANQPAMATILNNLGLSCSQQGKYDEAEPLYTQSLEIREREFGADHPETATSFHNLGVLFSKQGKYSEAENMYRRALLVWEESFPPDHPSVVMCQEDLKYLLELLPKTDEGEPIEERPRKNPSVCRSFACKKLSGVLVLACAALLLAQRFLRSNQRPQNGPALTLNSSNENAPPPGSSNS